MEPASSATEPTDEELVHRAKAGHLSALDQLVRRHQAEVSRLLWRFVPSHADLEDQAQEVFLRVVRFLPQWRAEQPFVHWLRRVTVNAGRDFCRREAVRRRWLDDPARAAAGAPARDAAEPGPDPAARAAANEVKELLGRLSPDDRTLLTLQLLEGWELARIGDALGWSTPVTKLRAFRARRRLSRLALSLEPKP